MNIPKTMKMKVTSRRLSSGGGSLARQGPSHARCRLGARPSADRLGRRRGAGVHLDHDRQAGAQQALLQHSGSTAMRTGTRCTILVKLPVAFSGGSRLNTAPEAGAMLSTRALISRSGKASTASSHLLARPDVGELRLLEVGVDMDARQRHQGGQPRAGLHIGADLDRLVADDAVDRRADE